MDWTVAVLVLYLTVLAVLSVQGLHRAWLMWHWWRAKPVVAPARVSDWPAVTVQLPVFNERYVVKRLVAAAGRLDYPRDRLQIQVLDDSTDDTTALAREAVGALVDNGIDAVLLHREDRKGYKAGALAQAAPLASGELLAIFDADFVPEPDFSAVAGSALLPAGRGHGPGAVGTPQRRGTAGSPGFKRPCWTVILPSNTPPGRPRGRWFQLQWDGGDLAS